MNRMVALSLLLAGLGCGSTTNPAGGTLRVLFIGNSLTYSNDMPAMVAALARHTGGAVEIEVRDMSNPNYALEDHWSDGRALAVLDDGGWDVVVLQQGPSSLPENQANLAEFAGRWADLARTHGATPALYMVWPERARLHVFDAVRNSYTNAAEGADAALYPAGEAWRAAWMVDADLPLYDIDDYHPSIMGSYLAALTIFRGLTQRSVVGMPVPDGIPDDLGGVLQQAAEQATAQYGRH